MNFAIYFGKLFNGSKAIKKVLKILKYIGVVLILLIVLIQFFLWTSVGQTLVAQKATQWLGNKLQTQVSIKKVDISFFKFLSLEEVYIEDLNQDTLFFIQEISTEIDYWKFKNDSLKLNFGVVQVKDITYNLNQNKSDTVTNITQLFSPLASNDTSSSNLTIEISASQVSVNSGKFYWNNKNEEQIPYGVDWNHIGLSKVNVDITDFEMVNDSFNAHIQHISGEDQSGFELNNFSGKAIFSSTLTDVKGLNIHTPYSDINTDLNFKYDSIGSYADFVNQVRMDITLDSSEVNFTDISYFASSLEGLDYTIYGTGHVTGPVRDMKFRKLHLKYGSSTVLDGRVFITGLPDIKKTYFACKFKKFATIHSDLQSIKTTPFTSGKTLTLPKFLKNSGLMEYSGNFTGFYNNFVSYGTYKSENGQIATDIKLTQKENGDIQYDGKVNTNNFNLAQLTNKPELFGKASINIDVKGENLSFKHMKLDMDGKASSFDFLGYTYKDVEVDAIIKNQKILGTLDIVDTNINLAFDGKIDLSEQIPSYAFKATVEHLRPKQLHLMKRDSSASLSSEVTFNFKGSSLDNVIGSASMTNFHFKEFDREVNINNIDFTAYTVGLDKTMSLKSENIDLQINGQFSFEEIGPSFSYVVYKWLPSAFKAPPVKPETLEQFTLNLEASRFSGFSSIFVPAVTFENDLIIDLTYNSEKEEIDLYSSSTHMNVAGSDLKDFELQAILTVDTFLLNSTANKVLFTDSNFIENTHLKATANPDLIKTKINWNNNETEGDDAGDLNFDIQFIDPNNFKILSHDSWVSLNDTLWTISDSSEVARNFKEFAFNNVNIYQENEQIQISGFISEDPSKQLIIDFDSLSLKHLDPILRKNNMSASGKIDGKTILYDFYNDIQLFSNTLFSNLQFNEQYIGNGNLNSTWNSEENKFELDVHFFDEKLEKLGLTGSYYPKVEENNLDLLLKLEEFPVKIIEPFTEGILDDIEGSISGVTSIQGKLKQPLFNGQFILNHLKTRVIYLNESLQADNQKVFITPNLIGADAIIITDSEGKKAQVNFSLFHNNFEDINYDAFIYSVDVFKAFNTTKKDNQYFFGNIYLNPGSSIGIESDYEGNINITGDINSGPRTFVTIPFFEDDEVVERDYIYFVQPKTEITPETKSKEDEIKEKEKAFNLNLDLALDKEAEVQLLFDEYTDDKIQATGNGNITLKINENQDFSIYGNYKIEDGFYLFTFSKVISKRFIIKEGGELIWNGDPYAGTANIDASYKVRTSIDDLGITASIDSTSSGKRIPVEVILHMTGNYMNPDLAFSFILPPKHEEVQTLLNTLDSGEKNKQVFALLILNKFLPISGDPTTGSSSALATNSSEVLSNQISNWLSKISNDFDVGVRYSPGQTSTDPDKAGSTADEIELALSTQLFDDRVLIETNLGITGDNSSTSSSSGQQSNFVGEFTVSYKINQKGNIVGKVFNRSNELNPVYQNTSPYTQGIGIAYSEPFKNGRNLGCILSNNFKKTENKRNCEKEYHDQQESEKEENLIKIKKKVANSREKQKKRNKKKTMRLQKDKAREERRSNSSSSPNSN